MDFRLQNQIFCRNHGAPTWLQQIIYIYINLFAKIDILQLSSTSLGLLWCPSRRRIAPLHLHKDADIKQIVEADYVFWSMRVYQVILWTRFSDTKWSGDDLETYKAEKTETEPERTGTRIETGSMARKLGSAIDSTS